MAAPKNPRYWDACTFLGLIKAEPDKVEVCAAIVFAAEKNHLTIMTSTITLTEVVSRGRGVWS